jgi:hypothetical protein
MAQRYRPEMPQIGRALRTETTIDNTCDFGIGKQLADLPALRQIGFTANRSLPDVQTISHDCSIGEETFATAVQPIEVDGQRAPALRVGDRRIQALFSVPVLFSLQARGFTNSDMRAFIAPNSPLDKLDSSAGRGHRPVAASSIARKPPGRAAPAWSGVECPA